MAREEFSTRIKKEALERQGKRCGSCAVTLFDIGEGGIAWHAFGERAEAHHIRHANAGGRGAVENCIILCRSCHYSVHGGGHFQDNTDTMQGTPGDYLCYEGTVARCQNLGREMDKKFGLAKART